MKKKDQFVIACLENAEAAATVLPYARQCAARLNKGIILLNVSKDGDNEWLKQFGLPYIGLKGEWKTAIDGLPTAFGGVLAVTKVDTNADKQSISNPTTLLKVFADCKIAYLIVGDVLEDKLDGRWPRAAFLTLDHRRESKEKLIWGSYMVRFFGSQLTVATPDYKDDGFREKVHNNTLFLKKIYSSLNVNYSTCRFPLSTLKHADLELMRTDGEFNAAQADNRLLIAMSTDKRDRDLGDIIGGPPERKLLIAAANRTIPLLLINQRDDLYVLCD